jgi:VWFA-related protein
MKKLIFLIVFIAFAVLLSQEIQHETIAINIEVPVRVYKGDNFVDDLTINDFVVYEDGILQDVLAVYLIKKTAVQRKEEMPTPKEEVKQTFKPITSRSFYLLFEVVEYSPKLSEAIDYFFQNVLLPSDNLTIVTPMNTYKLKSEALSKVSTEEAIHQIREILRKDAWKGNLEYRRLNNDLIRLVRAMNPPRSMFDELTPIGAIDNPLEKYEETMSRLESIRNVDQKRLFDFAEYLKEQPGQKYVILFYQREFIPQLTDTAYFSKINGGDVYTQLKVTALFGYYFRNLGIDLDRIKQAYADSSISINFLFFTKPAEHIPGIRMVEHSEDIFSVFREMAQATGGITTSSANPEYLFKRASDAVDSYYLLYYRPKSYRADGKFRNIKVKVKGKNYRVTHRAGYIAD